MSREMKNSGVEWIEEIPEDWTPIKLKHTSNIVRGGSPRPIEAYLTDGTGYNWIKIGDTLKGNKYIKSTKQKIISEGLSKTRYVKKDTLLLTNSMSYGEAYILDIDGCIHDGWLAFSDYQNANKEYLYYCLISDFCKNQFGSIVDGGVVSNLNIEKVKNAMVLLPPPTEQQQIANFLDRKCTAIDTAIKKTKKSIEKLEEYKKAVITKAVTKGLNPDVEMKDSGVKFVGMIPVNWTVQRLKFCLSESLKYGANESGINYNENLPRYIRITDITEDGKLKEADKLSLTIEQANNYILKDKDILLARSGATVGKSFLYKKEYGIAAFAGYLIKATVNEKLLPEYFNYITQSSYYLLWKDWIFSQATIQNIGADKYNQLPTVIPSIEEQIDITNYLDNKCAKIAEAISRQKSAIEKLEEYRKSLIYNAVTGKIDCRNEVIE